MICFLGEGSCLCPCLWLTSLPPSPQPPSRREGGDLRLFYARGFAPCIPGAEPARHWGRGRTAHPAGGVTALPPAAPAFGLLSCPHPPDPRSQSALPGGKGGILTLFCRGLRPRHPEHWIACGTYGACQAGSRRNGKPAVQCKNNRKRFPMSRAGSQGERGTGGEELRRLRWSSPPGQE